LYKGVLIELADVFAGVQLVMACLRKWNNQASTEAATGKHSHYAEVEQESATGVHLLGAENTSVAKHVSLAVLHWNRLLIGGGRNLCKD